MIVSFSGQLPPSHLSKAPKAPQFGNSYENLEEKEERVNHRTPSISTRNILLNKKQWTPFLGAAAFLLLAKGLLSSSIKEKELQDSHKFMKGLTGLAFVGTGLHLFRDYFNTFLSNGFGLGHHLGRHQKIKERGWDYAFGFIPYRRTSRKITEEMRRRYL